MKNLIVYIHLNPVKDKICKFPKEYKWSSYLEYVKDFQGICNRKFIVEYGFKGQPFCEFIKLAGKISQEDSFGE